MTFPEDVPDLVGEDYVEMLARLHDALRPKTYLEIGVFTGRSLARFRCHSIAIDPDFKIDAFFMKDVLDKPALHFFSMGSDDFFAKYDPTGILLSKIDFAFLDGMHRCEFLLRDFMNVEKYCKPNSVIALHDCLPVDAGIVSRDPHGTRDVSVPHREGWWAGDVWRLSLLLRRFRPDLRLTVMDCSPTGLVVVTNLDPGSDKLARNYADYVSQMLSWDLREIGIANLFSELDVIPAATLLSNEEISRRFWL